MAETFDRPGPDGRAAYLHRAALQLRDSQDRGPRRRAMRARRTEVCREGDARSSMAPEKSTCVPPVVSFGALDADAILLQSDSQVDVHRHGRVVGPVEAAEAGSRSRRDSGARCARRPGATFRFRPLASIGVRPRDSTSKMPFCRAEASDRQLENRFDGVGVMLRFDLRLRHVRAAVRIDDQVDSRLHHVQVLDIDVAFEQ